ncbi:MAG: sigma-70 family RNA polymerase sigma factor [Oscillospiraceae bacterium]|nr:sigma-70 family RNA polymerase sigma factor [Oscillospiraceae bacterium]
MDELHKLSDETLQTMATRGDSLAEEVLVQRFGRLVRQSARPLFLAGGDSEDLIQEGMLGLLAAIRTYSPAAEASFSTYAVVCIRNRLLTAIKTASRNKHTPLNQAVSLEVPQIDQRHGTEGRRDLEEQVLANAWVDEMQAQFVGVLSRFEHEILVLFLQGLSYQEMAVCTGKSTKSIDNAVGRIRKKLAAHLATARSAEG